MKQTDIVLDFGCGPGFYTVPFARIAREVVAVDIQSKMLGKVSRCTEKEGVKVKCLQSDGQTIPLPDESCDLIFLSGVYHELADKRSVLTELFRLLKPDGRVVIREKTRSGRITLGPPAVDTEEVFDNLRAAGFLAIGTAIVDNDDKTTLMTATKK